jgi:histone H3/H4
MKRRRVPAAAESAPEAEAAPEVAPEPEAAPEATPEASAPIRGVLRKSAIRRFLKQEAEPMKIREAFFAALEAKVTADLFRSVVRAKEQKRSTLMSSDA